MFLLSVCLRVEELIKRNCNKDFNTKQALIVHLALLNGYLYDAC